MKKYINSIWTLAVATLASSALLVGCQDTDYPTPTPANGPSTVTSRFLFVNAAPATPALNFLVENTPVAQNIGFGQAAAQYATVPAGTIQLRARAATGSVGGVLGSNDIVFRAGATNQTNFAAAANTSYTVFVTDTLNRPRPTTLNATNLGGPQFLVVTDVLTAPTAGNGGVRFFNLTPNGGSLSLVLTPATGTATTFAARAFRAISTGTGATAMNFASFTNVPVGTYTAQVRAGTTVVASTTLTVAQGKLYTVYSSGLRNTTGATAPGVQVITNN